MARQREHAQDEAGSPALYVHVNRRSVPLEPGAPQTLRLPVLPLVRHARANLRSVRRIDAPVLVIWGERDRYLGRELADPPRAWVPNVRIERLPNASHWVQQDEPARVNELLIEFLAGT